VLIIVIPDLKVTMPAICFLDRDNAGNEKIIEYGATLRHFRGWFQQLPLKGVKAYPECHLFLLDKDEAVGLIIFLSGKRVGGRIEKV
jgi:hypothetical protein